MTATPPRATCFAARFAAIALAVFPLSARAGAPVLHIADQKGLLHALCDAAHALDGASYDISWSEFPAAAPLLEALNAGAVDAGVAGDAPVLFAFEAGAPIHALLALRAQAPDTVGVLVPPQSDIRDIAGLRGHLVGVTKGSIGQALVLALMHQAGLGPHDLRFAYLSQMDAGTALRSGSIDAWGTWQPYIGLQIGQGAARLLADGGTVARGATYLVTSTDALTAKPAELGDFAHRLRRAQSWAALHNSEYAVLYSQATGVPLAIAQHVAKALVGAPVPMDASLQATERQIMDLFVQAGIVPSIPDVASLYDHRFERAALQD